MKTYPYAVELTADNVSRRVDALIEHWHIDREVSHIEADALVREVMRAIAINRLSGVEAQRAALAVLPLFDNDLTRWFA